MRDARRMGGRMAGCPDGQPAGRLGLILAPSLPQPACRILRMPCPALRPAIQSACPPASSPAESPSPLSGRGRAGGGGATPFVPEIHLAIFFRDGSFRVGSRNFCSPDFLAVIISCCRAVTVKQ
jgi:hypothetical protein